MSLGLHRSLAAGCYIELQIFREPGLFGFDSYTDLLVFFRGLCTIVGAKIKTRLGKHL